VVGFELGLAGVALLIAAWLGLDLSARMSWDLAAFNWAVIATVPMAVAMLVLSRSRWRWVNALNEPVEKHMLPLFKDLPPGGVALIALAAGAGEELLFRGVIQQGISDWGGPGLGLVVASVAFGLAHAVNRYYALVTMVIGVYLGLLYQASENIVLVLGVHALYDWVVLRFLLLRSTPNSGAKY
jgi:membrane protease YdiL (CAAX protease family)